PEDRRTVILRPGVRRVETRGVDIRAAHFIAGRIENHHIHIRLPVWATIAAREIGYPPDFQRGLQIHFPPDNGVRVPTGMGDGTSAPGLVGVSINGQRSNGATVNANLAGHSEYGSVRMRSHEGANHCYLRLA